MRIIHVQILVYLLAGAVFGVVFRNICFSFFGSQFYLGNLLVYLAGSFFVGYIFNFSEENFGETTKIYLITAVLGGLTTFSGFFVDILNFAQMGEFKRAFLYFTITNLIAIAGCVLGYQISTDND